MRSQRVNEVMQSGFMIGGKPLIENKSEEPSPAETLFERSFKGEPHILSHVSSKQVFFFHTCVRILKVMQSGKLVESTAVFIDGTCAGRFPGFFVGGKILVPRDAIPLALTPKNGLPAFAGDGLVPFSGTIRQVMPFNVPQRKELPPLRGYTIETQNRSVYTIEETRR